MLTWRNIESFTRSTSIIMLNGPISHELIMQLRSQCSGMEENQKMLQMR